VRPSPPARARPLLAVGPPPRRPHRGRPLTHSSLGSVHPALGRRVSIRPAARPPRIRPPRASSSSRPPAPSTAAWRRLDHRCRLRSAAADDTCPLRPRLGPAPRSAGRHIALAPSPRSGLASALHCAWPASLASPPMERARERDRVGRDRVRVWGRICVCVCVFLIVLYGQMGWALFTEAVE